MIPGEPAGANSCRSWTINNGEWYLFYRGNHSKRVNGQDCCRKYNSQAAIFKNGELETKTYWEITYHNEFWDRYKGGDEAPCYDPWILSERLFGPSSVFVLKRIVQLYEL